MQVEELAMSMHGQMFGLNENGVPVARFREFGMSTLNVEIRSGINPNGQGWLEMKVSPTASPEKSCMLDDLWIEMVSALDSNQVVHGISSIANDAIRFDGIMPQAAYQIKFKNLSFEPFVAPEPVRVLTARQGLPSPDDVVTPPLGQNLRALANQLVSVGGN